ncbi:serine/threonine-protein kinase NIM1-like [Tachypleus tridentatus]|uniref:serine/threonine-protein kinase NIM1-like n=1 Tax=Tachypleus tridentatus TaxID=6853 RepID=UPI003FD4D49A
MPTAKISPVNETWPNSISQATMSSTGSTDTVGSSSSKYLDKSDMTPYQRILKNLNFNERWQKDIALGRRIGFYQIQGELGTGNFSHVKIATHCLMKEKVAVKILDKSTLDQKTYKMLTREIRSMETLHHPHAIRLFEVIETFTKIFLIMEYANGGELFHRISTDGRFSEEEAKPLFAQVIAAVDHMVR